MSAVYRIVDTDTMEIVYIGFTRHLENTTVKTVKFGYNREGKYILDYIPAEEPMDKLKYYAEYKPVLCRPPRTVHTPKPLSFKERQAWKPFDSNERVITFLKMLNCLKRTGRYKEEYHKFEKYAVIGNRKYLRMKFVPYEYLKLLKDIRKEFCLLVNETYESRRNG